MEVSVFFFFFFFENLYTIPVINYAFNKVCVRKMLDDGYCDMSCFIDSKITRVEMLYRLTAIKSKYVELYQHPYQTNGNVWDREYDVFKEEGGFENMLMDEATAIVYWTYQTCANEKDKMEFTLDFFKYDKNLQGISENIKYEKGVFYNSGEIELRIVSSISDFNRAIGSYQKGCEVLYYRGHANANYRLQPSIIRRASWLHNEREMYNELMIACPSDFEKCTSHLEKLVKMQHYGLPTRLLDITKNALVALYFACESQYNNYGEIILISTDKDSIYYPQSDTASILASLPAFRYRTQELFSRLALDTSVTKKDFNVEAARLIHEIRLEKPAFSPDIEKKDLLRNIIVLATKNNNRIIKQDGAFILCGLSKDPKELNKFRYRKKGKTVVLLVTNKEKILEQLSTFSIDRATLFPEIDCVADSIKGRY